MSKLISIICLKTEHKVDHTHNVKVQQVSHKLCCFVLNIVIGTDSHTK